MSTTNFFFHDDQFPLVSNFQSKCQLLTFSSMISFHPCFQASAKLLSLAVQKSAYNFPLPGIVAYKVIIDQFPLVSNFQSKCQLLTFSSMISFHPCFQASAKLLSLAVQKSAYNFPLPGIVACSYAIVVGREDFTRLLQIKCFSTFLS